MESRVMITGGAGALGRAFAAECAERGWDLILTDIDGNALADTAAGLSRAYGIRVDVFPCDLMKEESRNTLYSDLADSALKIRMLINVAGLDYEGGVLERTREELRKIVRLNVEATLETTRAVLELNDSERSFRLITVSSLSAYYPMPLKATYAASKAFLLQFSLAVREELRSSGGSATALCPSGLPTREEAIDAIDAQGFMGRITAMNIGKVAALTIDGALKGRAVVIPGAVNRVLRFLGSIVPLPIQTRLLAARWEKARGRFRPEPAIGE